MSGYSINWGSVPDWFSGIGAVLVALVAVFQSTIAGWFYRPKFRISAKTERPDCVSVPITNLQTGEKIADSIYLRLWVENTGNAPAINVEVYAQELRQKRADGSWEIVSAFPPMNLKWSNVGFLNYPVIAPEMGKHCDCAHIIDPATRKHPLLTAVEENPELQLDEGTTSLTFDLISAPNHKGHVVGKGTYEAVLKVAASNAAPSTWIVELNFDGVWEGDAPRMMRDHVGIKVRPKRVRLVSS